MSQLVVSSSPHFRKPVTTQTIMRDVLIGLAPAAVASVILFGLPALLMIAVCVVACVLMEFLYQKCMKLPVTISDLSAAVTGTLLAFCLPSNLPIWIALIGCFVAIIIVKQLFGGLGCNFANPAIVARIVLMLSFAGPMSGMYPLPKSKVVDAVTSATPLAGGWEGSKMDLLFGLHAGALGELCSIALIIGGLYLIIRKVITPTIPVAFLGTMLILSLLFRVDPIFHILNGGALIGAFFMATDYVTSPITEKGKLIYGIACGLLTMVIRVFGNYPEGVSFAILIMNILTPHIDNITKAKPLGGVTANE